MYRTIFLLAAVIGARASQPPSLMPMPWQVVRNPGQLAIDSSFRIVASGMEDAAVNADRASVPAGRALRDPS
jgi:hypothetical protein